MGLYTRPESKYYWLYLETIKHKEPTKIPIGDTTSQRKDNKALALEVYHERMRETARGVHHLRIDRPAIRFSAYATTYAQDVIPLRRGAQRELEMLKPLRAFFADRLLSLIDADLVRTYMAQRQAQPRTVNREVDLLKGMLRDAVPKYLEASPIVGLKRIKVSPLKRRLLLPAEERRLLAVCADPQDRAILILGIDTMMRCGDLLDLERTDRDGPWLYVKDPKSGHAYHAALTPRAQAALDAIDSGDSRYYFPKFRRAEKPRDWTGSVRQRLETLCGKAGLPYGKTLGGLTFHWATRQTGATRYLIDQAKPLPAVQAQGGWKDPEMLLRIYAEARNQDQLKLVGALPRRRRA